MIKKNYGEIFLITLSRFITSSLPFQEAVRNTWYYTHNRKIKGIADKVLRDIKNGVCFSSALRESAGEDIKPYIVFIEHGEKNGKLSEAIIYIRDYLKERDERNGKIRVSLIYPFFVLIVLIGVMIILMTYVMPQLQAVFDTLLLPHESGGFNGIKRQFEVFCWSFLILLLCFLGIFILCKCNKRVKYFFDKTVYMIRPLKALRVNGDLAEFSFMMSMLLSSGASITSSLYAAAMSSHNLYFSSLIRKVEEKVKGGEELYLCFSSVGLFDEIFLSYIRSIETSGEAYKKFLELSDFYKTRANKINDIIVNLAEPVATVVIGAVIFFVVMNTAVPMFEIMGEV